MKLMHRVGNRYSTFLRKKGLNSKVPENTASKLLNKFVWMYGKANNITWQTLRNYIKLWRVIIAKILNRKSG